MITQDLVKRIFDYDPITGLFVRKISCRNKFKAGDVAGSLGSNGYVKISIKNKSYMAHRLAWIYMTGEIPNIDIDHINENRSDNAWANLRLASRSENLKNRKINKNNISGFRGVRLHKASGKWDARIYYEGKSHYLGCFETPTDASLAYEKRSKEISGKFYRNLQERKAA